MQTERHRDELQHQLALKFIPNPSYTYAQSEQNSYYTCIRAK